MEIKYKKLTEIKPYEKNPRRNDKAVEDVAKSIEEFGFKIPIVIDSNNVIVCGHTRYKASQKLGLGVVPCIVASDLSEEQVRAFRLVDNKVSEQSSWDVELLNEELELIDSIDMFDFGFDIYEKPDTDNERERTYESYNLDLFDEYGTEGYWQMPVINNDGYIPKRLIGFNYAKTSEDKDTGIHFFVDDYQFERLWNKPDEYLDVLSEYEVVLSPDFSLYMDMARPVKLWNVYRSRLLGHYWQENGIKVIPTVQWAEKETFDWCFDGIPKGSIVATSTIGVKQNKEAKQIWIDGMNAMIDKIQPSAILCYGGEVEFDYRGIPVYYFKNEVTERMKK